MSNPKAVEVRINASNVFEISGLTDKLDSNAVFTGITVYLEIVDWRNTVLFPKTAVPPGVLSGTYVTTLSKTQAPFEAGKHYTAQYSATMLDSGSNPVDYYEEQTLVGAAA